MTGTTTSSTTEPSEGAALSVFGGVSSAEKREQLEMLGEPWPLYSDGTPKVWQIRRDRPPGGNWISEAVTQERRAYAKERNRKRRDTPGPCGRSGCQEARYRNPNGTYTSYCRRHNKEAYKKYYKNNSDRLKKYSREYVRRSFGWYDEGGMATKPLRVKELT